MTVAACILAASPDSALREVDGTPNVRRLVDLAWAGGALPVIVVAPDPDGAVAVALAGAPATVQMCLVYLHLYGSTANTASTPQLCGVYAREYVGL